MLAPGTDEGHPEPKNIGSLWEGEKMKTDSPLEPPERKAVPPTVDLSSVQPVSDF